MSKPIIIGVAGTAGAGKDEVANILARLFGATNISGGDLFRAITRYVYDLPADHNAVRDYLYKVANYIRTEVDPAFAVKVAILKVQELQIERTVQSGLRWMAEADAIRAAGGIIVGVDADPHVRYERIFSRARDTESEKTFEQFLEHDSFENRGISDTGPGRGIRSIIDSADIKVTNEGTLEELEAQLKILVGPVFTL